MLVLTRKLQERIRIGDHITITVLRTKGKAVRLGIEAPDDVPVIRGELAFDGRHHEPSHQAACGDSAAEAGAILSDDTRRKSTTRRNRPHWPAKSRPDGAAPTPESLPTQVSLTRIPRRQLAGWQPQPTTSSGPLRALLDRRPTTT